MKTMLKRWATIGVGMQFAVFSFSAQADYPAVNITNKTQFPVSGKVNYASAFCKDDYFTVLPGKVWSNSRGVCLITGIWANPIDGKPITSYSSSGTSYSTFFVAPTQSDYRIWGDHEYARETSPHGGKSPGFHITNQTIWPVAIALEQAGCLYYGTIKPGQVFDRDTGGVWFTIKANIQADGKEPRTDWDCVKPVAIIVGGVLLAAATAGAASFVALPAAGTAAAALAPLTMSATMTVTGATLGGAVSGAVGGGALRKITAKEIGDALRPTGSGDWAGQYAGPEWPFRCDAKPTYVISGGWGRPIADKDGNMVLDAGVPLRLTKTNGCGNSMMATSSVSQPILPPPPMPGAAGGAQQAQAGGLVAVAAQQAQAQAPTATLSAGVVVAWINAANGQVPAGAVIGGQEAGSPLPVCRASYNNGVHPGKVVGNNCNIGWGGKELVFSSYEVALDAGVTTGGGYVLTFDGKVVSGADAASYTLVQAQQNCAYNKQARPTVKVECSYNGQPLVASTAAAPQPATGGGYVLMFDGKVVSGADAASYTLVQAQQNCAYNKQARPTVKVGCSFNGQPF